MGSDSSPKQVFRVNIFNQSLSISSSTSPAEFDRIANQVDSLMGMIASKSGTSDGTRVGVLAAMHLADRLYQAERKLESAQADLAVVRAGAQDQQAEAQAAQAELAKAREELDRARNELTDAANVFQGMKERFAHGEQARAGLEAELASARGVLAASQAELSIAQRGFAEVKAELEAERSRVGRDADRLHSLLEQALDPTSADSPADARTPEKPVDFPRATEPPSTQGPQTRDLFSFDDSDLARGATA